HGLIDPENPEQLSQTIIYLDKFTSKLNRIITDFEQATSIEQNQVVEDIEASFRDGILWVVDIPNNHHFDLKAAEEYIRGEISNPNENIYRYAFCPEAYIDREDKYHDVYTKFKRAGFDVKYQIGKNKFEDIDANLVNFLNEELQQKNYRVLILGSGDKFVKDIVKSVRHSKKGVESFIFVEEDYKWAHKVFLTEFGDEIRSRIKVFSEFHERLDGKLKGCLKVDDRQKRYFNEGKYSVISHAKSGKNLGFRFKKEDLNKHVVDEFMSLTPGEYLVKFRKLKGNYVEVLGFKRVDDHG
ncbi:MAG: hypothetical protein ACTSU5_21705, partial [Promethearchaeota archaeon]